MKKKWNIYINSNLYTALIKCTQYVYILYREHEISFQVNNSIIHKLLGYFIVGSLATNYFKDI